MTIVEDAGPAKGLVARVKNILLKPASEWAVIEAEPTGIQALLTGYVVPLAGAAALAAFIGMSVIGIGGFGFGYKAPIVGSLVQAVIQVIMAVVAVSVLALIIEALAPTFDGVKDRRQAFKLAAYSYTPAWVAGILMILPTLALLVMFLSLYGFYLLFVGLPKLMKAPAEKAVPYTLVSIVAALIVYLVVGMIVGGATAALTFGGLGRGAAIASNGGVGGKVRVGDAELDLGQLKAASEQMEASAKQMQAQAEGKTVEGAVQAVAPDALKVMLPGAVAGLSRAEISTGSGGVAGFQGSNAEAVYRNGDANITLSVTDAAAVGGLAGMLGAVNLNSSRETENGYEKTTTAGGRMITESYDRAAHSGEYGVMVGSRFMVKANGSGVSIEQLKAAVNAIDLGRLEGMAKG